MKLSTASPSQSLYQLSKAKADLIELLSKSSKGSGSGCSIKNPESANAMDRLSHHLEILKSLTGNVGKVLKVNGDEIKATSQCEEDQTTSPTDITTSKSKNKTSAFIESMNWDNGNKTTGLSGDSKSINIETKSANFKSKQKITPFKI